MRYQHTVQIAFNLNVKIVDDTGRDVSAWLMPVVYFWLWLPGWLWGQARPSTGSGHSVAGWFAPLRGAGGALLDLAGWRADLPLFVWAAWLLVRDRRFAYA